MAIPSLEAITCISKKILCSIIGTQNFPYHAYTIATLPEQEHGLGMLEPSQSTTPSFVIALAQSV
eukprot:4837756-Ditylum_brightwellii.AAC.1